MGADPRPLHTRKVPTTIYLRPDQVETIRAIAEAQRRPQAEVIREALDLAMGLTPRRARPSLTSAPRLEKPPHIR